MEVEMEMENDSASGVYLGQTGGLIIRSAKEKF